VQQWPEYRGLPKWKNLAVAIVAAASATAASTTPSALPPAAPTAASSAAAAFLLGARLVDDQGSTKELFPVECGDHFFCFGVVANLGKAKATRLAGEAVAKQGKRIRLDARFGKQRRDFVLGSFER
jgi:hypothetical protein